MRANGSTSHACRQVDKRADLWAFECVLYEMLAGRRAFDGRTPTDVLVSVIGRDPDWSALPSATPATVRGLVRQCLQQDARQRLEWDLAE